MTSIVSPERSLRAASRSDTEFDLDPHLVTLLKPESFEADQYRMLRYAIEQACPREGCRVIAVTSPVAEDGKTLTTINLAGAMAKGRETRLLLLDMDLRRPSVAAVLGRNGQDSVATRLTTNGAEILPPRGSRQRVRERFSGDLLPSSGSHGR